MRATNRLVRSHLSYGRVGEPRPALASVIMVHDSAGGTGELEACATEVAKSREVILPIGFFGVHTGVMTLSAFRWYVEWPGETGPDPSGFGRSLIEIESLILDLRDASGGLSPPPILFGIGQGATVALCLAQLVPSLLTGIYAVDGEDVSIPGWAPERVPGDGLPVRLCEWLRPAADAVAFADRLKGNGYAADVHAAERDPLKDATGLAGWIDQVTAR